MHKHKSAKPRVRTRTTPWAGRADPPPGLEERIFEPIVEPHGGSLRYERSPGAAPAS